MRGKTIWLGVRDDGSVPRASTTLKGLCGDLGLNWETVRRVVKRDLGKADWVYYKGKDGVMVRVCRVEVVKVEGRGDSGRFPRGR